MEQLGDSPETFGGGDLWELALSPRVDKETEVNKLPVR
jgi:hypothetical protein